MDMPTPEDDIGAFVRGLDQPTLAAVLTELAAEHEAVRKRLERLRLSSQPRELAAVFRASLNGWRRSTRFLGYGESRVFGAELEGWLGEVEREVLPRSPDFALDLAEAFIESDAKFFERADDSDGAIGDAIRSGCTLWLRAAAQCPPPAKGWTERLYRLATRDDYGAREGLLRQADLLLDEPALRALVARFEAELTKALQAGHGARSLPPAVFGASGSLHLLSEALHDPDIHVRAVLRYSPEPNPVQKTEFVRAYLETDRPDEALKWLDGHWDHLEDSRLRLLAQTYARLQRNDDCAGVRRGLFDSTGGVEDFRAWRSTLAPDAWADAAAHARQRALYHSDPVTAANLLLELGDDAEAESALVARFGQIDGRSYTRLTALAETMKAMHRRLGATACYRVLLLAILDRGYARAYPHGARYLGELRALAREVPTLQPLEPHATFEAALRAAHGRKTSFWKHVADR